MSVEKKQNMNCKLNVFANVQEDETLPALKLKGEITIQALDDHKANNKRSHILPETSSTFF